MNANNTLINSEVGAAKQMISSSSSLKTFLKNTVIRVYHLLTYKHCRPFGVEQLHTALKPD